MSVADGIIKEKLDLSEPDKMYLDYTRFCSAYDIKSWTKEKYLKVKLAANKEASKLK